MPRIRCAARRRCRYSFADFIFSLFSLFALIFRRTPMTLSRFSHDYHYV
jgi:hypothetical protein